MTIRLVIVDDHHLLRAGLSQYFERQPGIEVVAEAANGEELLKKLRTISTDLLLLDMSMPGLSGTDLIARVKSLYPALHILVLSMHNEIQIVLSAMKAGAAGYIVKDCSPKMLLEAIKKVMATGRYLDPKMAEQLAYASTTIKPDKIELMLSDRELEIFRLIVEGKSISEIARLLFISDKTVSTHKGNLLKKLGFKNVVELVRYSMQHELFT